MFTWVCQRCGKEVDIAEVECPRCSVESGATKLGSAHGAARGPVDEEYLAPSSALPAARPSQEPRAEESLPPPQRGVSAESTVPRPAPPQHALAIRPLHLGLFLLILLISLAAAVYMARPDLFSMEGVSLPELPRAEVAPLQQGPVEVAGIRTWRDAEAKLKVRAVIVNHAAAPFDEPNLRVTLSDPEAGPDPPPAATFEVVLEEPIPARASLEIETDLEAPEGLTALPDWNRIRVALQSTPAP